MSDLDRIIRFVAVAEELSFSRAAAKLNVDQPWLSRQIQQLEAQIGYPLFVRNTRQVVMTREGEAAFESAQRMAIAAEASRSALRELGRELSARVHFGVSTSSFWVPARKILVERFKSTYRAASVDMRSEPSTRLHSLVLKGDIDCALVLGSSETAELEYLPLHRQTPGLIIPVEDSCASLTTVPLAALAGHRLAVTRRALDMNEGESIYQPFLRAGMIPILVPEGRPGMQHRAKEQRLFMVSIGWPHSDGDVGDDFVFRPVTDVLQAVEFGAVRRKGQPRRALDRFWSVVKSVSSEIVS